jgi:thioester reductase-like protein
VGHSVTGVTNLSDFSSRFIKGCIQLGLIPDWQGAVNFITVDYVSQALAHLSLCSDSLGKTFHFYHPQPARWSDLVDWLRSYGYPIQTASYAEWRAGIESSVDNALHPLLPTLPEASFESELAIPEVSSERIVEFDCRNTLTALANTSIECPPLNSRLLNSCLSYFVERDFLFAPTKMATG